MNILKIKITKKISTTVDDEQATETTTLEYDLPNPQSIQWDMADIEAEGCSGMTQTGTYFRDVIAKKVTLGVSWGALSNDEMSQILTAIDEDEFILVYPDAKTGTVREMSCYVNSRTAPMYRCVPSQSESSSDAFTWVWQGLSINFMEK